MNSTFMTAYNSINMNYYSTTVNGKEVSYLININYMSRTPVYEQIIEQIENYVLIGIYKSGDKLQSVRNLSIELSINPNTIQKAYSELDRRGITSSVPGRGSFISDKALSILKENSRNMLSELTALLGKLVIAGIGYDEILACVDDAFKQEKCTGTAE